MPETPSESETSEVPSNAPDSAHSGDSTGAAEVKATDGESAPAVVDSDAADASARRADPAEAASTEPEPVVAEPAVAAPSEADVTETDSTEVGPSTAAPTETAAGQAEAAEASTEAGPAQPRVFERRPRVRVELRRPMVWGFTATIGALLAIGLASALSSVSTVLVSVGVALFIALALDPLVQWLERHKMSRGLSIAVVFAGFAIAFGAVLAIVVPAATAQVTEFAAAVPGYVAQVQQADWFKSFTSSTNNQLLQDLLGQVRTWLSNPANLLAIGGGAVAVGTGLVSAVSTMLIALVLTLYFLASMRSMRDAAIRIAPAYSRPKLTEIIDQIMESVGGYVAGMAALASMNAIFSFILLTVMGVPYAALLAFLALLITMIPMVGPSVFWILATIVVSFGGFWPALIFAAIYFAYMQVEAYLMTPKVMTKAVEIPGSLVLIGAMVGGTLLGLLGALIAVPVTASLLMIIKSVFIPVQDAKVSPEV